MILALLFLVAYVVASMIGHLAKVAG